MQIEKIYHSKSFMATLVVITILSISFGIVGFRQGNTTSVYKEPLTFEQAFDLFRRAYPAPDLERVALLHQANNPTGPKVEFNKSLANEEECERWLDYLDFYLNKSIEIMYDHVTKTYPDIGIEILKMAGGEDGEVYQEAMAQAVMDEWSGRDRDYFMAYMLAAAEMAEKYEECALGRDGNL